MLGLRARSNAPYYLLNEDAMQFTTTNWYSLIVELNTTEETRDVESVQSGKAQSTKILKNGVLYIKHNGTMYDVQGKRLKN